MATTEVNIEDIGFVATAPQIHQDEQLKDNIIGQFGAQVTTIANILAKDNNTNPISDKDASDLLAALQGLNNLALGKQANGSAPSLPFALTEPMARDIDMIAKSYKAVGLDSDNATAEAVLKWQDLKYFGLGQIIGQAVADQIAAYNTNLHPTNTAVPNHSLQALIELVYVKAANDYIGTAMSDLKDALELTKETILNLKDVQNIHNMISATPSGQLEGIFRSRPVNNDGDFLSGGSSSVSTDTSNKWMTLLENFLGIKDVGSFATQFKEVAKKGSNLYTELLNAAITNVKAGSSYTLKEYDDAIKEVVKILHGEAGTLTSSYEKALKDLGLSISEASYTASGIDFGRNGTDDNDLIDYIGDDGKYNEDGTWSGTSQIHLDVTTGKIVIDDSEYARFVGFSNPIDPYVGMPTADIVKDLFNLKANLQALVDKIGPGTLSTALQAVIDDPNMPTMTGDPEKDALAVKKWIMDNLDQHSNTAATTSGQTQALLNKAIMAAETLNDSQQEDVKRVTFVFEAFYRSASSMLTRLNRLIKEIADNLA